jgi:hypothetical protein
MIGLFRPCRKFPEHRKEDVLMKRMTLVKCVTPTNGDRDRLGEVRAFFKNNGVTDFVEIAGRGHYIKILIDNEHICSGMQVSDFVSYLPKIQSLLDLTLPD